MNLLKRELHLNNIDKFNANLIENILCPHCKHQPVISIQEYNCCSCSVLFETHKYSLRETCSFTTLNQVIHMVIIVLKG
jgi:hypothetical protein